MLTRRHLSIRAAAVFTVLAIAALLAAPGVTPTQAQDTSSADTVTLQASKPAVGDTLEFVTKFTAKATFNMLLNGNPAGAVQYLAGSDATIVATVDTVKDGKVVQCSLKVAVHTRSVSQNGMPVETPTFPGKTYVATAGEAGTVVIKDSDGNVVEGEERDFTFPAADTMLNGDPVVASLPARALKVGETFDIPKAAANRQVPKSENMTVESMTAKLVGVVSEGGRTFAEFEVDAHALVVPQEGLKLTINDKGKVRVDVTSSRIASQALTGVLTVGGATELQPGQTISYEGSGTTSSKTSTDAKKKD